METKVIIQDDIYIPEWLRKELDGNTLLAKILLQRGIDCPEKVKEFLNSDYYQAKDPYAFPNMEESVNFILDAAKRKLRICVYGDYDVDGVTSTVILVELLSSLGLEVNYHIPDRFTEGYGMNKDVIRDLAKKTDIIITCDCGISNYEEVALAKELGIDVLVTDHHNLPEELPAADYILTPKLLDKDDQAYHIPGAGMAYFLTAAIFKKINREEEVENFLDLLSLSIVADVVPLQKENRYLLQKGLAVLANSERIGLKELLKITGVNRDDLSEEDIAYNLAPRINSAGRLENASIVVELLLSNSEEEAKELAENLEEINKKRKEIQDRVIEEADNIYLEETNPDISSEAVVLYRSNWHHGVLGIAAGRLAEKYNVPAILISEKDDGITLTGSARSIPGIDIYQELKKCNRYLSKFGGHAGAAGFSLPKDNLSSFKKLLKTILDEKLQKSSRVKSIKVDGMLTLDKVNLDTYEQLRRLAPFGEKNPKPVFISKELELLYKRSTLGKKHLRLTLAQKDVQIPAIWWWAGERKISNNLDLIYSIGINDYQGKREVQLVVEEACDSFTGVGEEKADYHLYDTSRRITDKLQIIDLREEVFDNKKDKPVIQAITKLKTILLKDDIILEKISLYHEGLKKNFDWNLSEMKKVIFDQKDLKNDYTQIEIINRYISRQTDVLVFMSLPPSLDILRELIYTTKANYLFLSNPVLMNNSINNFLKELAGICKYIINKRNGLLSLFQIASKTAEMESTVMQGVKVLEAKGLLTVDSITGDTLLIRRGKALKQANLSIEMKRLEELIRESNAFRRYISGINIDEFYNLFD
ncbi:single-stranded-DNA-specific exonuclease RecJ [Natronospora cellulosivora (SeqCode)]